MDYLENDIGSTVKTKLEEATLKIDDLQDKLGLYPGDIDDKAKNKFIKKAEKEHHDFLIDKEDFSRYEGHALSRKAVDRIFD